MSLLNPDFDHQIRSFAAGWFDSPEPTRLPMGATPNAANAFFFSQADSGEAIMGKRPGCRLVTPSCIVTDKPVDGLYEFRREGVDTGQLLVGCDGGAYLWDGAAGVTNVGSGFVAGRILEFMTLRNLAFVMDGSTLKLFDGTTLFDPGFVKPTAAPALAAVAPAGAGLTGTYQTLATWYDSTHDHESSPSDAGTAVALVAQDRQHTKPAGAPPANVDKWRIYCRRTDTNEVYFKLVAETVVGTATATEALTDATRNLASTLLAPLPNQNDVPPAFAFMANAQGYALGVRRNDSYVDVSFLGDGQSWHPKDRIGVARGDGQQLTTLKTVGKRIIAQKGRRTYELTGDRMPFVPAELSPAYGNHQQASSVEAGGSYFCWDDEKGPYQTDLSGTFTDLAVGRIATFVSTVNLGAEIRAVHLKSRSLVVWIVATAPSLRTRTILAYSYLLKAWLPPITGIEYRSMATFQLSDSRSALFVGDQWGRLFQYFTDNIEGVPSGSTNEAVSQATANTVTGESTTNFYTTGDGLKGLPVAVVDPTGRYWQWRIIASNTMSKITIDTTNGPAWERVPDSTFRIIVGGINWFWDLAMLDFGHALRKKKGRLVYGEIRSSNPTVAVSVQARFDDASAPLSTDDDFRFGGPIGALWGVGRWGTMLWASGSKQANKQRLGRSFYAVQVRLMNGYPNQPVQVVTFGITADRLGKWNSGP